MTAGNVRYTARVLSRSPTFVCAAVLSIGLGIGVTATAYSLVERVFFASPNGVFSGQAVRRLYVRDERTGQPTIVRGTLSWAELFAIRDSRRRAFTGVTGYEGPRHVQMNDDLDGVTVKETVVASNYFSTLGVLPAIGRLLKPSDARDDMPILAGVLSWTFWHTHFGGARRVLGQAIRLGGHRVTIVGVAPHHFSGLDVDATDVWVPIGPIARAERGADWLSQRSIMLTNGVVRLRPDLAVPLADEMARRALTEMPIPSFLRNATLHVELGPLSRARGPASVAPDVSLAGRCGVASLLVLLAGAANLVNLCVARLLTRRRDLAIRISLGATRAHIVLQLIAEAALLCLGGSLIALWIAEIAGQTLRAVVMPDVNWSSGPIDSRVIAVTVATAVVYGLVGAAIPGWRATKRDPAETLKVDPSRRDTAVPRWREIVVAMQLAISVGTLLGAAVFTHSTLRARAFDLGFDDSHSVFVAMRFRPFPSPVEWKGLMLRATEMVRRVPGVLTVGATSGLPYIRADVDRLTLLDASTGPNRLGAKPEKLVMSAEAMSALGIRPTRGRLLSATDDRRASHVVVVSETLAHSLWPNTDALGRCLRIGADTSPCSLVVGVTPDLVITHLSEGRQPTYFVPLDEAADDAWQADFLLARVTDPSRVVPAIRASLHGLSNDMVGLVIQSMSALVNDDMRSWRVGAGVLSILGAITLLLGMIGLYAVLSYTIEQRERELAIRAALGATAAQLTQSVLAPLWRPTLIGIAVGLFVALWIMRGVSSLLFQTPTYDVASIAVASLLLLSASTLAVAVPIWHAVRAAPATSLHVN